MNPKEKRISSTDWWVKPIEMLVHNWALIEEDSKSNFIVYFFHDSGTTKGGGESRNPFRQLRQESGYIAIIDSLEFNSRGAAERALRNNHFELMSQLPGPWQGQQPIGKVYDARKYEQGIYSNSGYWSDAVFLE